MKCQIPQISWHDRTPVLSVDFQVIDNEIRRLATSGSDGLVVIWHINLCPKNTVTVECACELSRHNKSVNVVRFSPSGEYLASGDDEGAVFLWKLKEKNWKELPELDGEEATANKEDWYPHKLLRGHLDDICDLNWAPNSEFLLSGSVDNTAIMWDVQKGQSVRVSKEAKSFVQGVAWDPLNQYQATISSDRMLRIYNAANGKVLYRVHKDPRIETADKVPGKGKLFHDDTLQSFCRRLTFSPDGELLFVPSGIREKDDVSIHTTFVFSRYELTHPIMHLPTGQKYTLAVRCCPVLFKLKGNLDSAKKAIIDLPYRILIAVATQDTILLYDTQQILPFAYISNIHYTHLTDLSWSPDGRMIIISSTDGYCSFIIFCEGELGEIYIPEKIILSPSSIKTSPIKTEIKINAPQLENVLNESISVSKDFLPITEYMKSSDLDKPITPKRTPLSNKKTYSIKEFFSPPGKVKVKKQDIDNDCVIVEEVINNVVKTGQTSATNNEVNNLMTNMTKQEVPQNQELHLDKLGVINSINEKKIVDLQKNMVSDNKAAMVVIDSQINKSVMSDANVINKTSVLSQPSKNVVTISRVTDSANNLKSSNSIASKSGILSESCKDVEMVDLEIKKVDCKDFDTTIQKSGNSASVPANPENLSKYESAATTSNNAFVLVNPENLSKCDSAKTTSNEPVKPKKRISFITLSTKASSKN